MSRKKKIIWRIPVDTPSTENEQYFFALALALCLMTNEFPFAFNVNVLEQ